MKKQSFNTLLSLTAAAVLTVFAGQAQAQNNADLAKKVEQNARDIKKNQGTIGGLAALSGLNHGAVKTLEQREREGRQQREAQQNAIDKINADLKTAQNNINGNQINIDSLRDGLAKQRDTLNDHTQQLNQLRAGTAERDKRIQENKASIDKINPILESLNHTNQALGQKLTSNETQIKNMSGDVNANKTGVADNKKGVADNKKGVADNKKGVAENKAAVERAQAGVAENKKGVADNKAAVERAQAGVAENKKGVADNKAAIAANLAAINRLTQSSNLDPRRLESVEARTAQNAAKIQQLDKKVNDLDKEVRRGLASQAALGGLFQPYNVGKLNVSAAVGGYRSETAVAVGTGFRFNEHFATKAGAAFNTKKGGSASYNVGVNFEW
ncbi:YadA-like family protein [Neisseria animaloris]|uniref:YadA-like family protein n=1 Tax=Neisseria animaloris TaxID=326522 RepID=UPI0039DF3B00